MLASRVRLLRPAVSLRLLSSLPITTAPIGQPQPQTPSERATEKWVNMFVCELNLCPFAKDVVKSNKLRIKQVIGEDSKDVATQIIDEIVKLQEGTGPEAHESTLLVVPQFRDFDAYLDLVEDVQTVSEETELCDDVQIATFHPDYMFRDTSADDVTNWTNRSPYPAVHLLRTDDVSNAIDAYKGNTEIIWTRNKKTVNKLGLEKLQKMMSECTKEDNTVEEVLTEEHSSPN